MRMTCIVQEKKLDIKERRTTLRERTPTNPGQEGRSYKAASSKKVRFIDGDVEMTQPITETTREPTRDQPTRRVGRPRKLQQVATQCKDIRAYLTKRGTDCPT